MPIKVFNGLPSGLPSPVEPAAWEGEVEDCINQLGTWINNNYISSYPQYMSQYKDIHRTPLIDNPWEVSQHLNEWTPAITPTKEPEQFQRLWTIRTNAVEQNNMLIYVCYVEDSVQYHLGILRRMSPGEVGSHIVFIVC